MLRLRVRAIALACVGLGLWSPAAGQPCGPEWSNQFASPPPINGEVRGLAFFDDGSGRKLYAGGTFDRAGGQVVRGMMRWEGDHWAEFGGGVHPITPSLLTGQGVYWVGTLDTGAGPQLYIGGLFESAGGVPAKNLARWTGGGWAPMGAGFTGTVRGLTIFDDGTGPAIYAVGQFASSGVTQTAGIAKWNGAGWKGVGSGLSGSFAAGHSISVLDLGQGPCLVITGQFTHAGGVLANSVAAWDGQSWSAFGAGFGGSAPLVMKAQMFDHGQGPQLTVGGTFSLTPGPERQPRVARWTGPSGGWVQVGSALGGGQGEYVSSFGVFPGPAGPTLYAGGPFHTATWLSKVNYVARLEGGEWQTVDGGMSGSSQAFYLRCLLTAEEGGVPVLYASGGFAVAGDAIASRVARWNGIRWEGLERQGGFTANPDSPPSSPTRGYTAQLFDDGSGQHVFVGGDFLAAGTRVSNGIAAWDGHAWRPLGGGVTWNDRPGRVEALLPFDDGSGLALYAAGSFDAAGGGPCFSVARWNGAGWTAPGGNGITRRAGAGFAVGYGRALESFDDGTGPALYIGGEFDLVAGTPASGIAKWDGAAWSPVGSGAGVRPGYSVSALAVFDEGQGRRLFAGGKFMSIDGVAAGSIARWDGAAWSAVGAGFPYAPESLSNVEDLRVFDDGSGPALYAAGTLGVPSEGPLPLLARWDGAEWHTVPTIIGGEPLRGSLQTLVRFDDGSGPALYAGGSVRALDAGPMAVVRLRNNVWDVPGGGLSYTPVPQSVAVGGMAVRRDGDHDVLLVTGLLSQAGMHASVGVAELHGCAPCYPDCNGDAALNLSDFGCFQTKFALADPYADCNADGVRNLADFGCFQTRFAAGCP